MSNATFIPEDNYQSENSYLHVSLTRKMCLEGEEMEDYFAAYSNQKEKLYAAARNFYKIST